MIIGCIAIFVVATADSVMKYGIDGTTEKINALLSAKTDVDEDRHEDATDRVKDITSDNRTQSMVNNSTIQPQPSRVYFGSVDELISFLDEDGVNEFDWIKDCYMCGEFTNSLIKRAEYAGYNTFSCRIMEGDDLQRYSDVMANVSYTSPYGITWQHSGGLELSGAGHAVCETTIGNKTIIIEPQNDMIFELLNGIYSVLYKGEITKYGQKLLELEDRTYFESIDDLILFFDNDYFNKIEWNESVMAWDWDSSKFNEVTVGHYNGDRFEWGWDVLDALSKRAEKYGCNTLLYYVIKEDELLAYSDALSNISYRSGSTTWSYVGLDLASVDTKIVFKTIIGNSTFVIEPQTDMIFEFKDGKYIVQYKGEITQNE